MLVHPFGVDLLILRYFLPLLLIVLESHMDLADLSIVVLQVICLRLESILDFLFVLCELFVISGEVLVDLLELVLHSLFDIFLPGIQVSCLFLEIDYQVFAHFSPLPQVRLIQAQVEEIVQLANCDQPSLV